MNIYIVQQTTGLSPKEIKADREKLINLCKNHYVGVDDFNILDAYQEFPDHPASYDDIRIYALGSALLSLSLADVVVFGPNYKRDSDSIIIESVCKKHLMPCLYANDAFTQLIKSDENTNNCSTERPDEKVLTKADLVKTRKIFDQAAFGEGYAYSITKDNKKFEIIITKFSDHALNYVYVTKDNGTCLNGVILVDQVIKGDIKIDKSLTLGCLGENEILKTIEYIDETAVDVGSTYSVEFDYGSIHYAFTERLDEVANSNMLVFGGPDNIKCVFVKDISDKKQHFQMKKVK